MYKMSTDLIVKIDRYMQNSVMKYSDMLFKVNFTDELRFAVTANR